MEILEQFSRRWCSCTGARMASCARLTAVGWCTRVTLMRVKLSSVVATSGTCQGDRLQCIRKYISNWHANPLVLPFTYPATNTKFVNFRAKYSSATLSLMLMEDWLPSKHPLIIPTTMTHVPACVLRASQQACRIHAPVEQCCSHCPEKSSLRGPVLPPCAHLHLGDLLRTQLVLTDALANDSATEKVRDLGPHIFCCPCCTGNGNPS